MMILFSNSLLFVRVVEEGLLVGILSKRKQERYILITDVSLKGVQKEIISQNYY
jgi:hypothetical protein